MNYAFIYDKQQNRNNWKFPTNRAVTICTCGIHYDSRIFSFTTQKDIFVFSRSFSHLCIFTIK